jgi:excisionase family DNA binding protein
MTTRIKPRGGDLWTSAEVAQAFRVGVSSIKRWTDEGELEAVRTPGHHRRYTLPAIHRFARIRSLSTEHLPVLPATISENLPRTAGVSLFDALRRGDAQLVRRLLTPAVSDLAKRATFLDRVLGEAMREIGELWERGELDVEEEHRASYILAEEVDRIRPALDGSPRKLALLACPPDEWHDLPLRLVRLVLEWSGWRTDFVGAHLPWSSIRSAIQRVQPQLIAMSSRSSEPFMAPDFERFVAWCNSAEVTVTVGGEWARGGTGAVSGYYRFRTVRGFERWLRGIDE